MNTRGKTREENTFENLELAQEWIQAIESEEGGSRDREIYPMIKEWSSSLAPDTLVEIGSGQGVCSSKVTITEKYIGIEPSTTLVERAKEIYKEPNKEFLIGSSYEIPLEKEIADAVFSVGVWFHIKDLDRAHKEIYRILKPGAEVLIITANPDMYKLWEKWFDNPKKEGNRIEGKVAVPTGTLSKNIFYLHTEQEIIESLKQNNFYIKSIQKFGYGKDGYRDEGVWMAVKGFKK